MSEKTARVRLFVIIDFQNDTILPDFFNALKKRFGKYDYFTQNIKYTSYENPGYCFMRIFSFKEKINPFKVDQVFSKIEKIKRTLYENKNDQFKIIFGYINPSQVVAYENAPLKTNIEISSGNYASIQLVHESKSWTAFPYTMEELSNPEIKLFFHDLRRFSREDS